MTYEELIDAVAARGDVTKADAAAALVALRRLIASELGKGGKVYIPDLGSFSVRVAAARIGRNPVTGAPIAIEARQVVKFSAAGPLRRVVAGANA